MPNPLLSPHANFDRVAAWYDWLETVCAAGQMGRARNAFLADLQQVTPLLVVGEGPGRCLAALRRMYPAADITVLDASAAMLARSERRVSAQRRSPGRVRFIQGDVREWPVPAEGFVGVVTHFVLDCFPPLELADVIERLTRGLRPDGRWLVADFRIPRGMMHWPARGLVVGLYAAFRCATHLSAHRLTDPAPLFERLGMRRQRRRLFAAGMVYSELWRKTTNHRG